MINFKEWLNGSEEGMAEVAGQQRAKKVIR